MAAPATRYRSIQRDPVGIRPIERLYEKHLYRLLDGFRASIVTVIEQNHGRALEAPPLRPATRQALDPADIINSVKQIASTTISEPAGGVADDIAKRAYYNGMAWAEKAIRSTNPAALPGTPEAKPYFLPADLKAIEKIKARNLNEIQGVTDEVARRTSRALIDGFEKQETIASMVRRVTDVTDFGKNRATMIVRTETMRASNDAARERYSTAGIEKVQWLAGGEDGRTCEECLSYHLKIYPIDDLPADIPVHPNCRCTLAPVVGDEG